jgi:hypothetical protein
LQFVRRIDWSGGHIKVSDELTTPAWSKVEAVGIGAAQTSIYVVMSRTFQAGQMQPWIDLTDKIHTVRDGEALKLERVF